MSKHSPNATDAPKPANFLRSIIQSDIEAGRVQAGVQTRFPPEPNGYLHIGHAKSICINFGLAEEFGGQCNLRFDDTNPEKESDEFIQAIQQDIQWLGFQWAGEARYASAYFDQLFDWAIELIKSGKAYVCDLTPEQAREYRGSLTEPGKNSPFRERSIDDNLRLFQAMRDGQFDDGACVLRAKIDMSSPNMNLRDPILYRIRRVHHHQTGDKWCIYPTYDFTHGQSDAIEHISHSICTLEFEDHRPLYEWFIDNLSVPSTPRQYEFARLNVNYTVTSKRKLKQLVDDGVVNGWDDPRMPTIAGMRRRGITPTSLRHFVEMTGVARSAGVVDVGMLDFAIRDDLDKNAARAMCVLNPLKVTLKNYPAEQMETLTTSRHPNKPEMGERQLPFGRMLYIDRADFQTEAEKDFKRLVLGQEVRLRNAYVIRAEEVVRDGDGNISEIIASYDPDTLGKNPADGRKVKGVIHWVAADKCRNLTVRLYERLFTEENPEADKTRNFMEFVNRDSLTIIEGAKGEWSLGEAQPEDRFQFEREGYFVADRHDYRPENLVFNRTITLRDSFGK